MIRAGECFPHIQRIADEILALRRIVSLSAEDSAADQDFAKDLIALGSVTKRLLQWCGQGQSQEQS